MGGVASTTGRKLRTTAVGNEKYTADSLKKLGKTDNLKSNVLFNRKSKVDTDLKTKENSSKDFDIPKAGAVDEIGKEPVEPVPEVGFLERAISLGIVKVNTEKAKFNENHESLQQLRARSRLQDEYDHLSGKVFDKSSMGSLRSFDHTSTTGDTSKFEPSRLKFLNPKDLTDLMRFYKSQVQGKQYEHSQDSSILVDNVSREFNIARDTSVELIDLINKQFIRLPHLIAKVEATPAGSETSNVSDKSKSKDLGLNSERIVIIDVDKPENLKSKESQK